MDDLEFLEEQLESKNIHIDYRRVEGLDGLYSLCADGHEVIAVAPDLTRNKKTAVAYHEAGHKYAGISGCRAKDEKAAEKWAAYQLLELKNIIYAVIKSGCRNLYELAEVINVDEDFLKNGLKRLSEIHGEHVEMDDHVVNFCPFIIYDRLTMQMWPEACN